jgi:hypothetical protein
MEAREPGHGFGNGDVGHTEGVGGMAIPATRVYRRWEIKEVMFFVHMPVL